MKKILSLIIVFAIVMSSSVVSFAEQDEQNEIMLISAAPEGFYDISTAHFAYDAAKKLYSGGFISGNSKGELHPEDTITREEAVKIALAINRVETESGLTFDSPDGDKVSDWAKDIIATAVKYGVVRGDEDGSIRPSDAVTRAELVAVAMRALNVQISGVSLEFTDVEKDEWYYSYLGAAHELGIVSGYQDGTFRPESNITRAESFVIFDRILTLRTALENAALQ